MLGASIEDLYGKADASKVDPAPAAWEEDLAPETEPIVSGEGGAASTPPLSVEGPPESVKVIDASVRGVAVENRRIRLIGDLSDNQIEIGENIVIVGEIRGHGNVIQIADTRNPQKIHVNIHGNHNRLVIGRRSLLQSMRVDIGSKR